MTTQLHCTAASVITLNYKVINAKINNCNWANCLHYNLPVPGRGAAARCHCLCLCLFLCLLFCLLLCLRLCLLLFLPLCVCLCLCPVPLSCLFSQPAHRSITHRSRLGAFDQWHSLQVASAELCKLNLQFAVTFTQFQVVGCRLHVAVPQLIPLGGECRLAINTSAQRRCSRSQNCRVSLSFAYSGAAWCSCTWSWGSVVVLLLVVLLVVALNVWGVRHKQRALPCH